MGKLVHNIRIFSLIIAWRTPYSNSIPHGSFHHFFQNSCPALSLVVVFIFSLVLSVLSLGSRPQLRLMALESNCLGLNLLFSFRMVAITSYYKLTLGINRWTSYNKLLFYQYLEIPPCQQDVPQSLTTIETVESLSLLMRLLREFSEFIHVNSAWNEVYAQYCQLL